MESDSYNELSDIVNSPDFDVFSCIEKLKIHADSIGVRHFLVNRLYKYSYLEVEFYIPQLIQILVSYESDSMALADFLFDYSEKYPHFCLVVFWNLQAYVFELKNDPESYSFHVVRGFINELQSIMFNFQRTSLVNGSSGEFRENLQPAIVMGGMIAASLGVPGIQTYAKPIIISQAKQQKSLLFKLANFHKSLTKNITMKNRVVASPRSSSEVVEVRSNTSPMQQKDTRWSSDGISTRHAPFNYKQTSESMSNLEDRNYNSDFAVDSQLKINNRIVNKRKSLVTRNISGEKEVVDSDIQPASYSMPDLSTQSRSRSLDGNPITPIISNASSVSLGSLEILESRPASNSKLQIPLLYDQKVKYLQVNYFKKVTEFMMTLHNISARLSQVPKDARLTSLRAELAIINNTLVPGEIDVPQLLPISSNQNRKFHKILKLNVNEACVLNSAERVPFLLLIEYLSEEMDFNPLSEQNKAILQRANVESSSSRRQVRLDSSTDETSDAIYGDTVNEITSNVEEADLGDLSVVEMSNEQTFITNHLNLKQSSEMNKNLQNSPIIENDVASSKTENSSFKLKNSFVKSFSPEPLLQKSTKDLSTQMRIAAVMLQQLEKSGQANSEQSAAIKVRIIESMKALQDNFESIDYQQITEIQNSVDEDAGERKLENDFKLGEDWATKKNRIRKASSYGHLKNWDLCSVIAKNGDDLPQEAFACQLIAMISNIWKRNNVGVWTKNMKILITSANAGLVETINNAMSIHSIKKSLTEMSVRNGENPKGKVASLEDYFKKVYGQENSSKYKKAQDNFARSLAAYSIICYLLQIKDRHNGNIMLDNEGHIIHIDFGFLLSNSPGSVGFEAAPFKLSFEYVEVLGGLSGKPYLKFKQLCKDGFRAVRKHCDQVINIVDLMQKDSSLPCFKNGAQTSILLKQRFQLDLSDEDCDTFVENILIGKSLGSVYTRLYDQFQLLTQGIYS
ncbi:phosphatidylinositol 4-kinase Pik1p [[Candida] anglica]